MIINHEQRGLEVSAVRDNTIVFDDPYEARVHQIARRRLRLERRLLSLFTIWIAASVGLGITIAAAYFEVIPLPLYGPLDSVTDYLVVILGAVISLSAIFLIGNCLYHWSDLTWRTRVTALALWLTSVPVILIFLVAGSERLGLRL